jgi:hypothetical protein
VKSTGNVQELRRVWQAWGGGEQDAEGLKKFAGGDVRRVALGHAKEVAQLQVQHAACGRPIKREVAGGLIITAPAGKAPLAEQICDALDALVFGIHRLISRWRNHRRQARKGEVAA